MNVITETALHVFNVNEWLIEQHAEVSALKNVICVEAFTQVGVG